MIGTDVVQITGLAPKPGQISTGEARSEFSEVVTEPYAFKTAALAIKGVSHRRCIVNMIIAGEYISILKNRYMIPHFLAGIFLSDRLSIGTVFESEIALIGGQGIFP